MRIKADFITNSSSTAYIIVGKQPIYRKNVRWTFHMWEHLRSFKTKKQLIAFTQKAKCDWVNLIRGPKRFYNLSPDEYEKLLKIINDGNIAIYAVCDHHRDYNKFSKEIEDKSYGKIIWKDFQ